MSAIRLVRTCQEDVQLVSQTRDTKKGKANYAIQMRQILLQLEYKFIHLTSKLFKFVDNFAEPSISEVDENWGRKMGLIRQLDDD